MPSKRLGNSLLDGLPARDRGRFASVCEQVDLTLGDVVQEPGGQIRFVYFPVAGMISLLIPSKGHGHLEVGLVGTEGFVGVPAVLGVNFSPLQGLVQGPGAALRVGARAFKRELDHSSALRRSLGRYTFVLMTQLAETAACIKFHRLEARLARWLLMTHDRAKSNDFHLTQEFLAQMLGVRRVGVTNAAGELQKKKLITNTRGEITVLDSTGLEAASCSCYQSGEDIYAHTLG
jgi:CRP-like cAMP-binding protein